MRKNLTMTTWYLSNVMANLYTDCSIILDQIHVKPTFVDIFRYYKHCYKVKNDLVWNAQKQSPGCAACNFIKKETLAQVFSCEFCGMFKNTFFIEHL